MIKIKGASVALSNDERTVLSDVDDDEEGRLNDGEGLCL